MKSIKLHVLFKILLVSSLLITGCSQQSNKLDLSGKWEVALDSLDKGITEKWFEHTFTDKISLPGTLCDAGYGNPCKLKPAMEREVFLNLKRKFDYVGVAWYSRKVNIPSSWKEKNIFMSLERIIWESMVWIDGQPVGQANESLSTPHIFNLTKYLTPGEHTMSIRINNRKKHDITVRDMAHAYTNETQTMWNGILGELYLEAKDRVSITDLAIFPDVDNNKIRVELKLDGLEESESKGKISFYVKETKGKILPVKEIDFKGKNVIFDYFIENPLCWDEFNPNLYEAVAELNTGNNNDSKTTVFGMRKITNENALLQINGRRFFLRGTLECCIFPLKGYPPTDKQGWRKVYEAARAYGLNHLRFHSWCPPKAAFEVADEMGFYLQVELPLWALTVGQDEKTTDFLFTEAGKIMKEYGNHPSFCFWSMGNELQGSFAVMDSLMMTLKNQDPRHLYMTTTFTFERGHGSWPEPNDDFWVSQWTKKGWVRGQGVFDDEPVCFDKDYSASIDSLPVPIITHEIGQYSVFPNLKEISKYQGNLIPLNFLTIKNELERKGRFEQADDYLKASGKLACILYKEEIERALKTPGISGFQLLDLHDFPGQGTALVGILDAFWESKGLISAEEFKRFCSPVVPLLRFAKATYLSSEIFEAQAEIANFSDKELKGIVPAWRITKENGTVIAEGKLPQTDLEIGNNTGSGSFSTSLSSIKQAEKLLVTLMLENTSFINSWEIWVYPQLSIQTDENVFYTRSFSEARDTLEKGKTVLLNPEKDDLNGLEGKFVQVFWSPVHFPNQPGTMGILCNPQHPALKNFPTEMHSNWQWWDICKSGKTLDLDSLENIQPVVRMVDNFYKNRNLGLIFEAKSGKGKLLFCGPDLSENLENRPVASQLRYSLTSYMSSPDFNPSTTISFDRVEKVLFRAVKREERRRSIYE